MNKTILIIAAVCAMTVTSCKEDGESIHSLQATTCNFVTSVDGSQEPQVSASVYSYEINMTKGTMTVVSSGIDNVVSRFTTDAMPYRGLSVSVNNYYGTLSLASSSAPCVTPEGPVTDFSVQLTPFMYAAPTVAYQVGADSPYAGIDLTQVVPETGTLISYNIGSKYRVRTFWPDQTFTGQTAVVTGSDETNKYVTSSTLYRVKMNISAKKAMGVIYYVMFNSDMTELACLVLPELDIVYTAEGIEIKGENVVPLLVADGVISEYTGFTFDRFKYSATGDLVTANIEYETSDGHRGSFSGNYMDIYRASN